MKINKRRLDRRTAKAKKVLTLIAELMDGPFDPDDPGHCLWMILSALRGPDAHDHNIKEATTEKIRAVIGVKPYPNNTAGVSASKDKPKSLLTFSEATGSLPPNGDFHFYSHYSEAVKSLKKLGYIS
jgi:hypothetical protein